jgi:histidyl-tRNA synthetase
LDNGLADEYQKIASLLRDNKINAMIYFEQISLGQQLSYASEMEIPYVLIYGSKEKEAGIYVLKDMVNKAQREIKSEDLMKEIVL